MVIVAVDDYLRLWLSSALAFVPASSRGRVALVQNLPLRTKAQALLLLFAPLHPDLFAWLIRQPTLGLGFLELVVYITIWFPPLLESIGCYLFDLFTGIILPLLLHFLHFFLLSFIFPSFPSFL